MFMMSTAESLKILDGFRLCQRRINLGVVIYGVRRLRGESGGF
jgi:hypothetical protein